MSLWHPSRIRQIVNSGKLLLYPEHVFTGGYQKIFAIADLDRILEYDQIYYNRNSGGSRGDDSVCLCFVKEGSGGKENLEFPFHLHDVF